MRDSSDFPRQPGEKMQKSKLTLLSREIRGQNKKNNCLRKKNKTSRKKIQAERKIQPCCHLRALLWIDLRASKFLWWSSNHHYLMVWPSMEIRLLPMSLVQMKSYWSAAGPDPVWLIRIGLKTDTHIRRMSCERKGRGWVMLPPTESRQRLPAKFQKLGEGWERFSQPQKEPTLPTP